MGYGTRRAPTGNAQLGRALAGLASVAIAVLKRSQSSAPPPAAPAPRPASGGKGGGFDWAGPARQGESSAPPIKKAPGQGGLKDAAAGAGPWANAPGATRPATDPWAPIKAEAEEEPSAETAEALLMLRAMIAAAKADGAIDAEERSRIAAQLDDAGLSPAARDMVLADFDKPLTPAALAKLASDPMLAAQLYAAAVVGAGEIAAAERAWLDEFAKALKLDRAAAAAIESRLV
jgi:uncharacterized membrane protein YebE (DUF533 family)